MVSFYFDLGSPYAYLTAMRIGNVLPEPAEWRPDPPRGVVPPDREELLGAGRLPAPADRHGRDRAPRHCGLPPIRWPDPWPSDYVFAMRATTFAFAEGAGREFTVCAYRHAFEGGADLALPHHVLEAARDAGLDPDRVEAAAGDPAIKQALRDATDAAHERGVIGVPTIAIGDELFWGDDRLEDAAAHLRSLRAA